MYVFVYVYVYACVCVYVCVCVITLPNIYTPGYLQSWPLVKAETSLGSRRPPFALQA